MGDDDQTIYQWRGSSVKNIMHFATKYDDVVGVTMEDNFRSTPGVVEGAATVIANNDPDRLPKVMKRAGLREFEYGDVLCLDFPSPENEAKWIADKVRALVGVPFADTPGLAPRGLSYSDIAVLLRSVKRHWRYDRDRSQGGRHPRGRHRNVRALRYARGRGRRPSLRVHGAARHGRRTSPRAWRDARVGVEQASAQGGGRQAHSTAPAGIGRASPSTTSSDTYLAFLEDLALTEEVVPGDRGEIVFYNLGKFSQVISDFEQIHFHSEPNQKYESFVEFLRRQAPDYYPEGWQDAGYVRPDAVQVMTVHQAKGMEWPAVFVPCLQRNRFPSKAARRQE